jgi:hypothetical protein
MQVKFKKQFYANQVDDIVDVPAKVAAELIRTGYAAKHEGRMPRDKPTTRKRTTRRKPNNSKAATE